MAPLLPIPGRLDLFTSQQCVDSQAQGNTGFQVTRFSRVPSLPSDVPPSPETLPGKHGLFHPCAEGKKSPRELKVLQKIGGCLLGGGGSITDPNLPSSPMEPKGP